MLESPSLLSQSNHREKSQRKAEEKTIKGVFVNDVTYLWELVTLCEHNTVTI